MVEPMRAASSRALRYILILAMPAVFFLSGCAARTLTEEDAYLKVMNAWTRGVKVYEGLETKLYASATYKGIAFREAYIGRYAKDNQLDEGYAKALRERESELSEKYNEFFFTAYTPMDKWNDFDDPSSIWKLYLEDGNGSRLAPVSIARLDASDPLLREFFPYMDLWSTAYTVKFPKYSETGTEPIPGANTKSMRLVITGVLGKGELVWKLGE
ncbi:MAG: hypothetical protein HY955_09380 [Deltaproteobacteria bacterium]|nr:hypothetical protein [Deltaproteobacteria bacterium]